METQFSDAEAVALARRGDNAAFATLVCAYQTLAFRAAYLILRDTASAEDVAQEAFVRVHRHLQRFRDDEPFRPWLLRIVTNLALNERRSTRRRAGLLQRAAQLVSRDPPPGPQEAATAGDEAVQVWQAINRLKDDDRVVLYLRYFLELNEGEIAGVIGRPGGTVKSRLHRASKRLRELIETEYPDLRST